MEALHGSLISHRASALFFSLGTQLFVSSVFPVPAGCDTSGTSSGGCQYTGAGHQSYWGTDSAGIHGLERERERAACLATLIPELMWKAIWWPESKSLACLANRRIHWQDLPWKQHIAWCHMIFGACAGVPWSWSPDNLEGLGTRLSCFAFHRSTCWVRRARLSWVLWGHCWRRGSSCTSCVLVWWVCTAPLYCDAGSCPSYMIHPWLRWGPPLKEVAKILGATLTSATKIYPR